MNERPIKHQWLALSLATMAIVAMAVGFGGCSGTATDDSNNGMGAADHPPVTYQGHGNQTVGPVALSEGNATITIRGDALYYPPRDSYPWDAGFSIMIMNKTTGAWAPIKDYDIVADNQSVDDTHSIYTRSQVYDVRTPGDCLIKVMANNETIRWEISIAQ